MQDYHNRGELLDYPSLVFRQLDRINMLLANSRMVRGNGFDSYSSMVNAFSALSGLESLVFYKLNNEDQQSYVKDKKACKISYNCMVDLGSLKYNVIFVLLNRR